MIMSKPGTVPQKWTDGTTVEYTNWQEKWPSNSDGRLYVRVSVSIEEVKYGFWCNQKDDEYGHYPLCMSDAIRKQGFQSSTNQRTNSNQA